MEYEIVEISCPFFNDNKPIAVKKLGDNNYLCGNIAIWRWIDKDGLEQWCFGDYKAILKCEF
jgi:hypothetical protein